LEAPPYLSFIAPAEAEAITRKSDGYLEWCPDSKCVSAASVLWLPLGELLVERGLLSTIQLELALAEQRRTGLRLGEVLVSMGYVSEAALARMLLEQVGLSAPPEPPLEELAEQTEAVAVPTSEPKPDPEPAPAVEAVAEPEPALPELQATPEPQFFVEPDPVVIEAPVSEPQPEPELRVAVEPQPQPELEPVVVRMEDTRRERGKWWSRNGNKARARELEKVLNDFEERSRAIEADIMRVRTTLRELRDARSS
jgi:hypothetical protein